jgi:hypothetical protein
VSSSDIDRLHSATSMVTEGNWLSARASRYDIQSPLELPLTSVSGMGWKNRAGMHLNQSSDKQRDPPSTLERRNRLQSNTR